MGYVLSQLEGGETEFDCGDKFDVKDSVTVQNFLTFFIFLSVAPSILLS